MKGFAFPSEKSAKDFLVETGNTEQKPSRGNLYRQGEEGLLQQDMGLQADERFNNELHATRMAKWIRMKCYVLADRGV